MLVRLLAVRVRGGGVGLGFLVVALVVLVRGLMVMMRGGLMLRGGRVVMLAGRVVLRRCHCGSILRWMLPGTQQDYCALSHCCLIPRPSAFYVNGT